MIDKVKVENGILEQIKHSYYITGTITKKGVFDYWIQSFKEFYKEYPHAIKWDYEKFIREILDYND